MKNKLYLKVQALHTLGEAIMAAHKVLDAERQEDASEQKLVCMFAHVERMESLYEECIQCCIEDIGK